MEKPEPEIPRHLVGIRGDMFYEEWNTAGPSVDDLEYIANLGHLENLCKFRLLTVPETIVDPCESAHSNTISFSVRESIGPTCPNIFLYLI